MVEPQSAQSTQRFQEESLFVVPSGVCSVPACSGWAFDIIDGGGWHEDVSLFGNN